MTHWTPKIQTPHSRLGFKTGYHKSQSVMDSFHIQSVIHTPDHRGMSCQTSCVNSNRRGGKMSQTQHPTVEISNLFEKYILHYHVMKYNLQDRRKSKEIIICSRGPGQA